MVHTNVHIICKTLAVTVIRQIFVDKIKYNVSPYVLGFKYCDTCTEWFFINDQRCPCCNRSLRLHNKSSKGKQTAKETKIILEHLRYGRPTPTPKYHLSDTDFENANTERHRLLLNNKTYYNSPAKSRAYFINMKAKPEYKIRRFMNAVDQLEKHIHTARREAIFRKRYERVKNNTGFRSFMTRIENTDNI